MLTVYQVSDKDSI